MKNNKKNMIFIVIDSLYYEKTIGQSYRNNPMPFLGKLRKEGLDCTNMYSEAPFTEAAIISLLCGLDTMKHGGFMKRMYDKENLMEIFKKNGYRTFFNGRHPSIYPSNVYCGVTDDFYAVSFNFKSFWNNRGNYYHQLYLNNELDDKDFKIYLDLLEDNLNFWHKYFQELKNDKEIVSFIRSYMDLSNLEQEIKKFNKQYDDFQGDKVKFAKELLKKGLEHPIFAVKEYKLSRRLSSEESNKLYKRYKKIIKKMFYKNFWCNLKNNKLVLTPKEERKNLFKVYLNVLINRFMIKKINPKYESYKKDAPSMDTSFKHFENWALNYKDTKPYFAYIHVDDCHSPEIFYTYDTNDFKQLDEEFNAIAEFVKKVPKNYKGNLSYDVSLHYADNCLRQLFKFLKEHDMLDKVIIAICADHGSSYSFDPYRSNYVNNVHKENYNMPFILWGKDIKKQKITGFYNSKDIPATLLDVNGIKIPKEYDGISILKNKARDYVLLENIRDGGCPDYNRRDLWLGIRNKKWLVVMSVNVHKKFEDNSFYAIYDLVNDPGELYNLKDTIDKKLISKEIEILKKEFLDLQKDVKKHNFLDT